MSYLPPNNSIYYGQQQHQVINYTGSNSKLNINTASNIIDIDEIEVNLDEFDIEGMN
jgi:hypothetical protein